MARTRIILLPGGKLQVFVDEGTDLEARQISEGVLATLQAAGIPLESIGEVEFHRTGAEHVHVENEVRLDNQ